MTGPGLPSCPSLCLRPVAAAERVAALPAAERKPWVDYLARSDIQRAAGQARRLVRQRGRPHGGANILSFQTPAGGWGKKQSRDRPPRRMGQDYVADNNKKAAPGDVDAAQDARWTYVGTIDNDATITEIRCLGKAAPQLPPEPAQACREAAERGIRDLLAAQFPNGGGPQVWPLQGGYHDAITYNDNAVVEVAELMARASRGEADLRFLPAELRAAAGAAHDRAAPLLLTTQVRSNGRLLLWGQQHDPLTLAPSSARNYEPPALSAGEIARAWSSSCSSPSPHRRSCRWCTPALPRCASCRRGGLMDINAGQIADGEATIEETGWAMFRLLLDVASGRRKTWAEHWKLHNSLVLFNPAPVT